MQSHSDAAFKEDPFPFLRQDLCWTLSLRWEKITVIFCTRCRVDGLKIISGALNDSQFGAPKTNWTRRQDEVAEGMVSWLCHGGFEFFFG